MKYYNMDYRNMEYYSMDYRKMEYYNMGNRAQFVDNNYTNVFIWVQIVG